MTTTMPQSDGYLTGKLLIATPAMRDPRFDRAVIFLCAHDVEGAMGLIINHPIDGLMLAELLEQMDIDGMAAQRDHAVMCGGPVEIERGFILHAASDFNGPDSQQVSPDISVSVTKDVLMAMASETPPQRARMMIGYSGWGPGQLEGELKDTAWLVSDCDNALLFDTPASEIWTKTLAGLGITPEQLSSLSGHA